MKSIMEYKVKGKFIGKITSYPKEVSKFPKTKTISLLLESLEADVKEHTKWEKYDYFILNASKLSDKISVKRIYNEINKQKDELEEMKQTKNFFTEEDYKKSLEDIDKVYEDVIRYIETLTNTKYGIDYTLK